MSKRKTNTNTSQVEASSALEQINEALSKHNWSSEQVKDRIEEVWSLSVIPDREERSFELARLVMGLISETSPEAFANAAADLGFKPSETAAFNRAKESVDTTAKAALAPIADSRDSGADVVEAFVAWRESAACWREINRKREDENNPAGLTGTPFAHYINSSLAPKVRAEMVAKIELYCKAGWARADIAGETESPSARRLAAVIERMRKGGKPPVDAKIAAKAVAERFDEIFVNIKVVGQREDSKSPYLYVAEKSTAPSGFNAIDDKGSTTGSGFVDIVAPVYGKPGQAILAEVSKGNPFETGAESHMKHVSGVESAIKAGIVEGVDTIVEFGRYCSPAFYTQGIGHKINAKAALGMDDELLAAGNLVVALKDLDCSLNNPLFKPELYLRSPLNVFGAADPWRGKLELARGLAFGNNEAANLLLVKEGLKAASLVMDHLAALSDFSPANDKIGEAAAKSANGLIGAFGDIPGLDAEIARVGASAKTLRDASKNSGSSIFNVLVNGIVCGLTVEKARQRAELLRPEKNIVAQARAAQAVLAAAKSSSPTTAADGSSAGMTRTMKASYARHASVMVEALSLALPDSMLMGESERLIEVFERYAKVADGTLSTRDPKTGGVDKSYQRCVDWIYRVSNGKQESSSMARRLIEEYLPWAMVNKGDAYNPVLSTPPTMDEMQKDLKALAKLEAKNKLGIGK